MGFLYYSTQTALAHRISVRYFKKRFYVYCASMFNPPINPGSSSPASLYALYRTIVEQDDRGNPKISQHKMALLSVAQKMLTLKKLKRDAYDALVWEVEKAETRDFNPVLYLILREKVKNRLTLLDVNLRANPNSEEYIIDGLKENEFELITPSIRLIGGL